MNKKPSVINMIVKIGIYPKECTYSEFLINVII